MSELIWFVLAITGATTIGWGIGWYGPMIYYSIRDKRRSKLAPMTRADEYGESTERG